MVLQLARAHKFPLCAVARPAGTQFLRFAWSQADADTRSLCKQLEAGNLCGEPSLKASDLTLGASALVAAALRFFKLKEGDAHAFITRGDSVKPLALRNRESLPRQAGASAPLFLQIHLRERRGLDPGAAVCPRRVHVPETRAVVEVGPGAAER
jgi:hypothetical protein